MGWRVMKRAFYQILLPRYLNNKIMPVPYPRMFPQGVQNENKNGKKTILILNREEWGYQVPKKTLSFYMDKIRNGFYSFQYFQIRSIYLINSY